MGVRTPGWRHTPSQAAEGSCCRTRWRWAVRLAPAPHRLRLAARRRDAASRGRREGPGCAPVRHGNGKTSTRGRTRSCGAAFSLRFSAPGARGARTRLSCALRRGWGAAAAGEARHSGAGSRVELRRGFQRGGRRTRRGGMPAAPCRRRPPGGTAPPARPQAAGGTCERGRRRFELVESGTEVGCSANRPPARGKPGAARGTAHPPGKQRPARPAGSRRRPPARRAGGSFVREAAAPHAAGPRPWDCLAARSRPHGAPRRRASPRCTHRSQSGA